MAGTNQPMAEGEVESALTMGAPASGGADVLFGHRTVVTGQGGTAQGEPVA